MDVTTAAPKTRRHWLAPVALGAVIAGLVGAAFLFGHTDAPNSGLQDASSGPLHAHYSVVNGVRLAVCDDVTAVANNDGRQGVAGEVAVQGPAVVIVTVVGNGRTRRVQQQVTAGDNRVSWDIPVTAPVEKITVLVKENGATSTCQVTPPTYAASRVAPLNGLGA